MANAIKTENPNFEIVRVPEGTPVTKDIIPGRVRLVVDANGKVVNVPQEG